MKVRAIISALLICTFAVTPVLAKTWRVDNNVGILNAGDFTTLQDAYDAAADGDTLYVFGSSTQYEGITFYKKLYIFGPGYCLGENPDYPPRPFSATVDWNGLTFEMDSEGSFISGIHVGGDIKIKTNDITCKRNRISSITTEKDISNITILQNFLDGSISIGENNNNILITNNRVNSINSHNFSIIIVIHNVIEWGITCYNSTLDNNILKSGAFTGTGNSYRNNIGDTTQFGTEDGNQSNVDMSIVFLSEGSTDGRYELGRNSTAIGAGTGDTDIGMFGGSDPYVLSGLPEIPLIYYFTGSAKGTETQGLEIHMKGKSIR